MAGRQLTFLLMGKTGEGKSATGNSILNRNAFIASSKTVSQTKTVECSFAQVGQYTVKVVDGPGMEDTDLDKAKDKETAVKNMEIALAMCNGNVDAFLLVIRFGARFTDEGRTAVESLKRIFGQTYLNHVIVIITGGDIFKIEMEDEPGADKSFHGWCRRQTGAFKQLYEDCNRRFVLINNKEKNEKVKETQVQQIIQLTQRLREDHGQYTSESFQRGKASRDKLIVEQNAPILAEKIQEQISLLNADIENLLKHFSESKKQQIKKRIQELKDEIKIQDRGTGVLDNLLKLVLSAEVNLDNQVELKRISDELEAARKGTSVWKRIGSFLLKAIVVLAATAVGVVLAGPGVVAAAVGATAGAVAGIASVVRR